MPAAAAPIEWPAPGIPLLGEEYGPPLPDDYFEALLAELDEFVIGCGGAVIF